MSAWRLKEAKESCEMVFDRAWSGEPQIIMRDEKPMVVVLSYVDFRRAAMTPTESRSSWVDKYCGILSGEEVKAFDAATARSVRNDRPGKGAGTHKRNQPMSDEVRTGRFGQRTRIAYDAC